MRRSLDWVSWFDCWGFPEKGFERLATLPRVSLSFQQLLSRIICRWNIFLLNWSRNLIILKWSLRQPKLSLSLRLVQWMASLARLTATRVRIPLNTHSAMVLELGQNQGLDRFKSQRSGFNEYFLPRKSNTGPLKNVNTLLEQWS